jgi:lysophospholipase L1-like esterase
LEKIHDIENGGNPIIIISLIMFGTNDAKVYFAKPVGSNQFVRGEERFVDSYESIVDALVGSDASHHRVATLATPPLVPSSSQDDQALQEHVIPRIHDIDNRRDLPLVDMRSVTMHQDERDSIDFGTSNSIDGNIYVPDGIHLTPQGYGMLAKAWMEQINKMIVLVD